MELLVLAINIPEMTFIKILDLFVCAITAEFCTYLKSWEILM